MMNENLNVQKIHNEIVLIRGLPGSGKTTLANSMNSYRHLEADQFLEVNGEYVYDASKVKLAHDWCVSTAKECLDQGLNVVISNTFVKLWELQRYIDLGFPFRIIEMNEKYQNIHGVPQEKIDLMAKSWQELPAQWRISA
jgi:ABC-type cobalamin/Fe3+-siderophores transport system ATPase subunit